MGELFPPFSNLSFGGKKRGRLAWLGSPDPVYGHHCIQRARIPAVSKKSKLSSGKKCEQHTIKGNQFNKKFDNCQDKKCSLKIGWMTVIFHRPYKTWAMFHSMKNCKETSLTAMSMLRAAMMILRQARAAGRVSQVRPRSRRLHPRGFPAMSLFYHSTVIIYY